MKKFFIPFLFVPMLAWGQASFGHLDSIEFSKIKSTRLKSAPQSETDNRLTFFMRVADDAAAGRVAASGATIEQREGNILVVTAPIDSVETVAATEGVISVSLPKELTFHEWTSPYGPDLSRTTLGLDRAQDGVAPLSQAYTGKDVVVGIIDMGIDVHHISLLNPDGTHRVKRAWKHVQNGKAVATLTANTEEKVAKFTTDNTAATHGTHVMGIAAGNFISPDGEGPDFRGAAPEATLAVSCGVTDTPRLLKGLRSIVDYAREEGMPCVINLSLGSNVGPHDGTDEFPAALNEIAGEEGVTVCVSAGNEGADNAFLYHEFEEGAETLRTIINPSQYTASLWPGLSLFPQAIGAMEIWSDDDTPFTVHLDVVKFTEGKAEVVSTFTLPETGSGYLCSPGLAPTGSPDVTKEDDAEFNTAFHHSFAGGASEVYAPNNRYHSELTVQLECSNQNTYQGYRIALRVEGQPGHRVFVYGTPMSGAFGFSFIGGFDEYTASTADGSINAMAGADNVITVGSYISHNMTVGNDVIGTTASYSSWGHTPDGRLHPLVSAPGSRIISSMSSYYFNGSAYDPNQISYYAYTAPDGTEYHWTPMSGTSMAAPYMTGIAAMWLSADPTLTTDDIVRIAQETARTPAEPRDNDGAGAHVDAFAGLCKILNLSGINNVTTRSSEYEITRDGNIFTVSTSSATPVSVTVYSLQGSAMASADGSVQQATLDASSLAPGIYLLNIASGTMTATEKIIIK